MLEAIFTPDVIQVLAIESPIVVLAMFAIWALMHSLIKALNVIVDLATTLKDLYSDAS